MVVSIEHTPSLSSVTKTEEQVSIDPSKRQEITALITISLIPKLLDWLIIILHVKFSL